MPEPKPAEPAPWAVRPLSVHVPPGERRNPVAMVRMAIGPLEVVLGVSRLKKSGLVVRLPMAEGVAPVVSAAPEVWAVIERPPSPRSRAIPRPGSTCWASASSGSANAASGARPGTFIGDGRPSVVADVLPPLSLPRRLMRYGEQYTLNPWFRLRQSTMTVATSFGRTSGG